MGDDTPMWNEYTVRIGSVEFPTYQIDTFDDGIMFAVHVDSVRAFKPVEIERETEVETPDETFVGRVAMVAIEERELSIRVERVAEDMGDGMRCHECGRTHADWTKDGEHAVDDGHHAGIIERWKCGHCGAITEGGRR